VAIDHLGVIQLPYTLMAMHYNEFGAKSLGLEWLLREQKDFSCSLPKQRE